VDHQNLKLDDLGKSIIRGRGPELYTKLNASWYLHKERICVSQLGSDHNGPCLPTHSRVIQPRTILHMCMGTKTLLPAELVVFRQLGARDRSGAE
jgi:hypothetical protein